MNAYAGGIHEEQIRAIASEVMPGVPVSISSEVLPEMYEYERAITTVANSYVAPVVQVYVSNLEQELKQRRSTPTCTSCAPTAGWPRLTRAATRR